MKTHAEATPPAPMFAPRISDTSLELTFPAAPGAASASAITGGSTAPSAAGLRAPQARSIYVVDDAPYLTLWYTVVLKGAGYLVRAFNDRVEALAALKADPEKPELLITDYRGLSMPVERFMRECLAVHPALRILMATGFGPTDVRLADAKPDRFIRKPFTLEEFEQEVKAALAA